MGVRETHFGHRAALELRDIAPELLDSLEFIEPIEGRNVSFASGFKCGSLRQGLHKGFVEDALNWVELLEGESAGRVSFGVDGFA